MPDRRDTLVTVELDDRMVSEILSELRTMPGKMKQAQVAAVKKTMRSAEAELSRKIKSEANLLSKDIKQRITQPRKPSTNIPRGVLRISGVRIPLWRFSRSMSDAGGFAGQEGTLVKKRKPRKGAGWKIYKTGKRERHKNFFIRPAGKSGQLQILKRPKARSKGGGDAVAGVDYKTAYGVSLSHIVRVRKILKPAEAVIRGILAKNLRSQVDRFLKRRKSQRA